MIHLIACGFLIGAREVFDAEIRCDYAVRPKLYRSLFFSQLLSEESPYTHARARSDLVSWPGPKVGYA